jgi:hypothetical protein
MSVLVDNGILSPEFDSQLSALRYTVLYAQRLWKARTARNPASDALVSQLTTPHVMAPHVHGIARLVRAAEHDFNSSFNVDKLDKKRTVEAALSKQRTAAAVARAGSSADEKARKAMMPAKGHAQFLHLMSRKDIRTLASFRYNRVRLNHVLHSRGAAASPDCPICPGETESLRHALLACPKYAADRARCFACLSAMHVPSDYATLLGAVETLHEDRRRTALGHIVHFLTKIREARQV